MPVCSTCGAPDHLRCNCAQTPYCDQCANNDNCNSEMDSACVIYHPDYPNQTTPPTHLIYLGLPNGSSAQTIFEAIDAKFGALLHDPIIPVNTQTVNLTVGADGRTLSADVNVSSDAGNLIAIHTNGLFVANPNPNYLVKVDANDSPDYLFNQIVGDTNGCITIDVLNQSGLVTIRPNLDFECFANSLCAANLGVKEEIANCLLNAGLQAQDTATIDLNLTTATPNVLTANAKVSADSGNVLVAHADGLYVPTPVTPPAGLTTANNGLSVTGGNTVQLGGPLIQNTTIGFNSGAFLLSFNSSPHIYIGEGTVATNAVFHLENTYQATGKPVGAIFNTNGVLGSNSIVGVFANAIVTSGTDTDHSNKAGLYGQLFFNGGTTATLSSFAETAYTATLGLVVGYGTGTVVSGAKVISGVTGTLFAADNATFTSVSALQAKAIYQAPQGGTWTGTVTNYYGLYIEDASSNFSSNITNKYAIFQAGTTSLNVFSTAATISDVRKKENIINFSKGLDTIDQLRTVQFNFKDSTPDDKKVGVIAQEVEAVLPEAIYTRPIEDLEDFKLVEPNVIFYTMLNAIKELSARVKALEAK